jgi:Protein of unknown function (DUF1592)/Protein of unknown function (DUF1588)/Protein of unknown function (DUF1595)/Protein of unknown function (DUF1585)/Protein of unknown function (DUF1587)
MMRRKQPPAISPRSVVFSVCLLASACAGRGGSIGSGNAGSTGNPGSGGSGAAGPTGSGGSSSPDGGVMQPPASGLGLFEDTCTPGTVTVGSTPVRRISRIEYDNMIRDLGLDPNNTQPAMQFVSEQKIDTGKAGNFNTNSYATISGTLINQQYLNAAETLAAAAVANNLSTLVPCTTKDATCATTFITSFAGSAFRGQLDSDEAASLLALYNTVSAQFDFPTGIQAIIESVLTSPRFLFVLEFGQPATGAAAAIPLTPMELATRLSLYLWRSLPDQTLIGAATGGHLVTTSDVATQAKRMLADPKATAALQDFANQWLDIENMDAVTKDTIFKNWTASVAQDLHTETLTTFTQAVLGNSDYKTLLTSPSSYINADLASFYGVGGSPTFGAPTNVSTAANPRMGILTDASVLAAHAHTTLPSPTLRGRMMRQQILCEEVPDPPAAVGGVPIPPPPANITAGTTRAAYLQHVSTNSVCSGCHQYMDWIGFGFDNYDATGAYITTENGTTVDSSGKFVQINSSDITGTFTGTTDMITQLAGSQQVNQCFALEELRYALLRSETDADACSAQQIYQTFSTGSFNLQQLLVAVVSSDAFMYRTPVNAGGACQ